MKALPPSGRFTASIEPPSRSARRRLERQAEPRAAVPAGRRGVAPLKRLEQAGDLLGALGDADPRVEHLEPERQRRLARDLGV